MSTIKVDTLVAADGSSAVTLTKQHAPKVWFELDGTGPLTVDGSFNVSSAADNGTGTYTANYTNSMNNTNYAILQGVEYTYSGSMVIVTYNESTKTTGAIRTLHNAATGAANVDVPETCGLISGDLA